jgi:hypothetical protein
MVPSQSEQIVHETLSQKHPSQKKGLVEWLKVKALSSSPSGGQKGQECFRGNKVWNNIYAVVFQRYLIEMWGSTTYAESTNSK